MPRRSPSLGIGEVARAKQLAHDHALPVAGLERLSNSNVDMTRAFNEGKVKPSRGRIPENTTPTRFEDFAGELARDYLTA
ncbi:MAG: hypothetical protein ACREXW_03695 [Gammaproteobacteria bacterium]